MSISSCRDGELAGSNSAICRPPNRLRQRNLAGAGAAGDLVEFLASADLWVIPYRRNIAGVSVPSRLYNLLAVGRAVIVAAEPHAGGGAGRQGRTNRLGGAAGRPASAGRCDTLGRRRSRRHQAKGTACRGSRRRNITSRTALARYREVILERAGTDLASEIQMTAIESLPLLATIALAALLCAVPDLGDQAAAAALCAGAAERALLAPRSDPARRRHRGDRRDTVGRRRQRRLA